MTTQENTTPKGQISSSSGASDAAQASSVVQAEQLAQKTDKEIILDDLKQTMRDLGRIPRMIMAPVITYIASKREHIPEERRNHLQKIVRDIKGSGSDGIQKLKEWFGSKHEDTSPSTASTSAAPDATTPASVSSTNTSSQVKSSPTETKVSNSAVKSKSATARTPTTSPKGSKRNSSKSTKSPSKKAKDTA